MVRILVADDHSLIRVGLTHILLETPFFRVTGEASTGEEAVALVHHRQFDIVIMDVLMPGRGGLDAMKEILTAAPYIKVIILTAREEDHLAVRALREGASAVINKRESTASIIEAITTVLQGRRYITPRVADVLAHYVASGLDRSLHETLTGREMQVLVMMGSGYAPKRIAEELSLSIKTVNTYRSRLKEKLNLGSNAEIIKYALENKLS